MTFFGEFPRMEPFLRKHWRTHPGHPGLSFIMYQEKLMGVIVAKEKGPRVLYEK
jgi:hypothetical protein